jgi:hypothetical protein
MTSDADLIDAAAGHLEGVWTETAGYPLHLAAISRAILAAPLPDVIRAVRDTASLAALGDAPMSGQLAEALILRELGTRIPRQHRSRKRTV